LAEVQIINGETLESALKRFKRKVMNEDIIKDIKRHAFYLKPGQKMRGESGAGAEAESQEPLAGF